MKTNRQLHLWIGLITSVLILIEAITGLILNEPWLIGGEVRGARPTQAQMEQFQRPENLSEGFELGEPGLRGKGFGEREGGNSLMGIIKGLHAGRIGNTDVTWIMDLAAIGLIVLTVTGIVLSLKILKAQKREV